MIHLKKDASSFNHFAQELIKYDYLNYGTNDFSIKNLQLIITDDDPAIQGSFKQLFTNTSFALCYNHIQVNV